jgi:hypothetical protein
MRTISGFVMAIGLCLVVMFGDASARGFGGFRGGYGGFYGGDRERSFRAGEDYGERRGVHTDGGFYAGGWGMDETDDSTYDDRDHDYRYR